MVEKNGAWYIKRNHCSDESIRTLRWLFISEINLPRSFCSYWYLPQASQKFAVHLISASNIPSFLFLASSTMKTTSILAAGAAILLQSHQV